MVDYNEGVPRLPGGCGACSRRDRQYCETRLLADHCCCEPRYVPEPLPWLPHTCYAGPRRCTPLAGDCERYSRLRDCCCYNVLAKRCEYLLLSVIIIHKEAIIFATLLIISGKVTRARIGL